MSLSGVAGFGGGVVVLPVLVWVYGPEVAVPVVAIFQLMGTSSRSFGDRFPTAFPDPRVRSIHERRKQSWQYEGYRVERQSSPGTRE